MGFLRRVLRAISWVCVVIAVLDAPASTAVIPSSALPQSSAFLAGFDAIPSDCSQPADAAWVQKVESIKWVAYSSPNPHPDTGYYRPDAETIYKDLLTLKKAGFTGLITYASSGIVGKQFLTIASSLGYQGTIMGIWSPAGIDELSNAASAAAMPIVLGYSIGNEGLGDRRPRYSVHELCSAISDLRSRTGKPVTTSEDIDFYYRWPALLTVGDWLFPISHPYWHFTNHAADAIQWEQDQYSALVARTVRFVFFKEVGLPTAGAAGLSEANQDVYYRGLAQTGVRFAYFEGFDQPSKTSASVEPHWGIFNSDLTPKLLAWNLMGYRVFTGGAGAAAYIEECPGKEVSNCTHRPAGTFVFVGNDRGGTEYRAILSFNTSGLPDNAIITAMRLKMKSEGIAGTNPLTGKRVLAVQICIPTSNATGAHPGVFSAESLSCDSAGIFDSPPNSGWYTGSLLQPSFASVNLQGATNFRILVSGPGLHDWPRAYIRFFSPDASASDCPVLLVRYRLP